MSRIFVCPITDIPSNGMKQCETEGGLQLLVASSGNEFFACKATCPHQESPLCEGLFDGCTLTCDLHYWQWDIRTGAPVGLAEAPLEMYETHVVDGAIYVVPPE